MCVLNSLDVTVNIQNPIHAQIQLLYVFRNSSVSFIRLNECILFSLPKIRETNSNRKNKKKIQYYILIIYIE